MRDFFQLLPFILFILFAVVGHLRRQKKKQAEPEVVLQDEQEVVLPPWGNFPMEERSPQPSVEPDTPPIVEKIPQPQASPPTTASDVPPKRERRVGRETASQPTTERESQPARSEVRTIAGIPLSPQTFRQGIILSEILGRPKSIRRPRS